VVVGSLGLRGGRRDADTGETWPHREEQELEAAERAEDRRRIEEALAAVPEGARRQATWCFGCRRAWSGRVTPEGHPADTYPLQEHSLLRIDLTPEPPDDGECRECYAWTAGGPGGGFWWWATCDRKTCGHAHHETEVLFA
jgi:hypothetical protein